MFEVSRFRGFFSPQSTGQNGKNVKARTGRETGHRNRENRGRSASPGGSTQRGHQRRTAVPTRPPLAVPWGQRSSYQETVSPPMKTPRPPGHGKSSTSGLSRTHLDDGDQPDRLITPRQLLKPKDAVDDTVNVRGHQVPAAADRGGPATRAALFRGPGTGAATCHFPKSSAHGALKVRGLVRSSMDIGVSEVPCTTRRVILLESPPARKRKRHVGGTRPPRLRDLVTRLRGRH